MTDNKKIRILQQLERKRLNPLEEQLRLERRVRDVPSLFREQRLLNEKVGRGEAPSLNTDSQAYWRQMSGLLKKYDFPKTYFLSTEEDELARAQYQLKRFIDTHLATMKLERARPLITVRVRHEGSLQGKE
jgi:hypothetical protein